MSPPGYTSPGPPAYPSNTNTQPAAPSPNSASVAQQIEGAAGLYEPAVYELLSFYSAMVPQPDELDGQFINLTDVQPTGPTQTLIFAVGFIPPSSNVTGRLLDRSATIAQTTPLTGTIPPVNNRGTSVQTPPGNAGPPSYTKFTPAQIAGLVSQQYAAMNGGQQPNPQLVWMLTAQSLRETSGNWPNNNPGFIQASNPNQPTFSVKGGGSDASGGKSSVWRSFDTPQAGTQTFIGTALRTPAEQAAAASGNVQAYVAALGQAGYYGPYTDAQGNYHDAAMAQQEYLMNFQALYNAAQASAPNPSAVNLSTLPGGGPNQITGDGGSTNNWQTTGSPNASQASQAIASTANTNLNTTSQGQLFQNQQIAIIKATQAAITQMQNTPPLRMLVNPQSFKLSAEKIISDGEWGRNGPIVEHWGDNLDKLEASGKVAAFYSADMTGASGTGGAGTGALGYQSNAGQVGGGPGITRIARQYSTSYQNFLSLWLIYKNNGGIWLPPFVPATSSSSSQVSNLSVLGSIYIYYDGILYIGSFDSFNLTESETAPYTLEYNFSFTVRATFLFDTPMDSNGVPSGYASQIAGLQQSQSNPLQGLPNGLQVSTGSTLGGLNAQPGGGLVSPPPNFKPGA